MTSPTLIIEMPDEPSDVDIDVDIIETDDWEDVPAPKSVVIPTPPAPSAAEAKLRRLLEAGK